jgi:hypothetical protein
MNNKRKKCFKQKKRKSFYIEIKKLEILCITILNKRLNLNPVIK